MKKIKKINIYLVFLVLLSGSSVSSAEVKTIIFDNSGKWTNTTVGDVASSINPAGGLDGSACLQWNNIAVYKKSEMFNFSTPIKGFNGASTLNFKIKIPVSTSDFMVTINNWETFLLTSVTGGSWQPISIPLSTLRTWTTKTLADIQTTGITGLNFSFGGTAESSVLIDDVYISVPEPTISVWPTGSAFALNSFPGGSLTVVSGSGLRSVTTSTYAASGNVVLNPAINITPIKARDEFRFSLKMTSNPTYVTFRFNDDWRTDVTSYLPVSTPLSQWFDYYFVIPETIRPLIGNTITSVRVAHANPGDVFINNLQFVQTDGGSLLPSGVPEFLGGRPQVPRNSLFRRDISQLPLLNSSTAWVNNVGGALHADFGNNVDINNQLIYGIPFNTKNTLTSPKISFSSILYADESDLFAAVAFPYDSSYKIERSSDKHLLVVDPNNGHLFESHNTSIATTATADSITYWDLRTNASRTPSYTSADAAGLPIYPLLLTYDDIAKGDLAHMLRFTKQPDTYGAIYPASHKTSGVFRSLDGIHSDNYAVAGMPMGAILRLKQSFDISGFSLVNQRILRGLKKYGMILADNGSSGYISGTSDTRWNSADLDQLKTISIPANFEAVDVRSVMVRPTSYQARP